MKRTVIACISLLFAAAGSALADAGDDFRALLDEHWEWTLKNSPVLASTMGDPRYNRDWTDNSLAAIAERRKDTREFLRRAYAIDRDALAENDRLNHELFRRMLQDDVDEYPFDAHLLPFSQRGGVQNLENTLQQDQINTFTWKVLYLLDYRWGKNLGSGRKLRHGMDFY